ncbi:MAG TPA: translation initiation factor IF-3 [Polyangiaceae bacterium]|nr:translation initiation factor IF-3 [Polyangiaceae bacterium]
MSGGSGGRRFSRDTRGPQIRVNHRIRVPEVRVVAEDGSNLGVLSTEQALRRAQEVGLDLVEVNPKGSPPVCKILDFGKYKYEEKKKLSEAKKKQTVVEVKEIKVRPKTDDHDLEVKVRAVRKFLESGNKVKVTCRFRGREIMHPERAHMQLDHIVRSIEDLANVEQRPAMEARTMTLVVAPKPVVFQKLAADRAQRERDKELARAQGRELPEEPEEEIEEGDTDDDDDDDDADDAEGDAPADDADGSAAKGGGEPVAT